MAAPSLDPPATGHSWATISSGSTSWTTSQAARQCRRPTRPPRGASPWASAFARPAPQVLPAIPASPTHTTRLCPPPPRGLGDPPHRPGYGQSLHVVRHRRRLRLRRRQPGGDQGHLLGPWHRPLAAQVSGQHRTGAGSRAAGSSRSLGAEDQQQRVRDRDLRADRYALHQRHDRRRGLRAGQPQRDRRQRRQRVDSFRGAEEAGRPGAAANATHTATPTPTAGPSRTPTPTWTTTPTSTTTPTASRVHQHADGDATKCDLHQHATTPTATPTHTPTAHPQNRDADAHRHTDGDADTHAHSHTHADTNANSHCDPRALRHELRLGLSRYGRKWRVFAECGSAIRWQRAWSCTTSLAGCPG